MYTGINRNGSSISKDVVDRSIDTIYNIPIIGEFIENKDDFGTHGGKVEISDQGVKFIKTTVPFGVVPSTANIYWEDVEENDGTINNYLNIEGAILWTGRYEEASKVIEEGRPQSMEIEVVDGTFNKDEVFEIQDMVFSALCILGTDVEPCFESANITAYSLDKDKFKSEFNQLLAELKYTMQKELNQHGLKGGKEMEETKKELVQEEFEVKEESPSEEVFKQEDKPAEEEMSKHEEMAADDQKVEEPDGDEEGEDTDDDGDGKDEKYELLESELTSLKESYSALESEVKELREFKAEKLRAEKEIEINEVFESVASKLTEDELAPFKEKAFEMEIKDLKKELFALIGQKEFEKDAKFNLNSSKPMRMALDTILEETPIANSYDAIIKKYNNK
jgi:hypothetical protein